MMEWGFVQMQESCGSCGAKIPAGSAAQKIELRGVKRIRYRGECCAGDAPPNLPASPVLVRHQKLDLSRIDALIPNRTRGALKSMARENLPAADVSHESKSSIPPSLSAVRDVRNLSLDRGTPIDRWLPHSDD